MLVSQIMPRVASRVAPHPRNTVLFVGYIVRRDLVPLMEDAGFDAVWETDRRRTAFGTQSLYRAEAPAA